MATESTVLGISDGPLPRSGTLDSRRFDEASAFVCAPNPRDEEVIAPMKRVHAMLPGLRICPIALLCLCAVAGPAAADTTIVTELQVTGPPLDARAEAHAGDGESTTVPQPVTVTTYLKGNMGRVEFGSEKIVLYDGQAGKIYTLFPASKTYYAMDAKTGFDSANGALGRAPKNSHWVTFLNMDKTSESGVVMGRSTNKYNIYGMTRLETDEFGGGMGGGGFGRHHGGFGRGGGGPAGGDAGSVPAGGGGPGDDGSGGGGGSASGSRRRSGVQFTGETWLAGGVVLPKEDRCAMLLVLRAAAGPAPFLKSWSDWLMKQKLLPLRNRITITRNAYQEAPVEPTVVTSDVKSVTDGNLDPSLFALPGDYSPLPSSTPVPRAQR
jgi:hypothetical protein